MAEKKTPYQRIMRAAERGGGVRLSVDDVFLLSMDDAIATRANNDDEDDEGSVDAIGKYQRSAVKNTKEGTTIVWMPPQSR